MFAADLTGNDSGFRPPDTFVQRVTEALYIYEKFTMTPVTPFAYDSCRVVYVSLFASTGTFYEHSIRGRCRSRHPMTNTALFLFFLWQRLVPTGKFCKTEEILCKLFECSIKYREL